MNAAADMHTAHATTVSIDGHGVMILGASGAGKSALALQLISMGAILVADDQTALRVVNGQLIADCPTPIKGLIEARGVGLLKVPSTGPTPVLAFVDLDRPEPDRLPHPHEHAVLGVSLPALWRADSSHFPAAVLLWVKANILSAQ